LTAVSAHTQFITFKVHCGMLHSKGSPSPRYSWNHHVNVQATWTVAECLERTWTSQSASPFAGLSGMY